MQISTPERPGSPFWLVSPSWSSHFVPSTAPLAVINVVDCPKLLLFASEVSVTWTTAESIVTTVCTVKRCEEPWEQVTVQLFCGSGVTGETARETLSSVWGLVDVVLQSAGRTSVDAA